MSSTLVRTDRVSGYQWADFYVDQRSRWEMTVTWNTNAGAGSSPFGEGSFGFGPFGGDTGGGPIDVTGYDARFVVIRAGLDATPILDLTSPLDIVVGGPAGTFSWDVPASPMGDLVWPVYQHELTLMPDGDPELAVTRLKGRVLVRASVLQVLGPPVAPGVGWGHGPWGHFPWGS